MGIVAKLPSAGIGEVPVLPSRAVLGLVLAVLALVSALDGYAAYPAPIWVKAGYAQHSSHAYSALAAAAISDDDEHSAEPGEATPPLVSEPLLQLTVNRREAWVAKARPAGQVVQHPPCAVPQTGPPAIYATA